ncbi:MAG: cobalamin biosynthesis protein CobD [Firmicutes bacterium]|nr:cobalamin biosynthesis protein CobD [Bacillota bacterium]
MKSSLAALAAGYCIDLIVGDPHGLPHPVIFIGKLISLCEKLLRKVFSAGKRGERAAGLVLWILVASVSTLVPWGLLKLLDRLHPLAAFGAETLMCWQILATRSLRDESMKVYLALQTGDLNASRKAVSMIVGRDTDRLDEQGVTRAAVETVAENTSDGIVAPMVFLALGGAPAGFFYKAVNTMDSMIGYIDPPYTHLGFVAAKMDDVMNYLPARLSALLMLAAGGFLGMNVNNGKKVFLRDRYNHASPNSAQTESVCAGLLGLQLAGDAWYGGVLHKKSFIGDPLRPIEAEDIPRACRLLYVTSFLSLLLCCGARLLLTVFL